MNKKLDVFEILNVNKEKNQEQQNAPDFDFLNVRALMKEAEPAPKPVQKTAPQPAPAVRPQPAPAEAMPVQPKSKPAPVQPETEEISLDAIAKVAPEMPKATTFYFEKTVKAAKPAPAPKPPKKEKKAKVKKNKTLVGKLIKIAVLITVIAAILIFIIGLPKVSMNSMDPLISSGDRVAVNKVAKSFKKGDIVVFKGDSGEHLAARIVAVHGDVVSINNKNGLYINNELQVEENIHTVTTVTDTAASYPVIVDDDTYFVLGDNRTDSVDSRNSSIGLLDEKDIIGKVIFCFKRI